MEYQVTAKVVSLAGVTLMLGVAVLSATAISAETIRARYSLQYLNLNIGEISTFTSFGASDYQTLLDARVTGLATLASSFTTSMKSNGVVKKGLVLPSAFLATEATNSSTVHKSELLFDAGNVKSVEIDPPFDDAHDGVPVTEEHKRDVVDPSSALIMSVPNGKPPVGPAACDRTLRVFNGTVRFDLSFKFIRIDEHIAAAYSGPVSVCSIQFTPIAGHKPTASMVQFMAANRKIEVRLAPVMKSRLVVMVALTVPLQIGTATLNLETLRVEPAYASELNPLKTKGYN